MDASGNFMARNLIRLKLKQLKKLEIADAKKTRTTTAASRVSSEWSAEHDKQEKARTKHQNAKTGRAEEPKQGPKRGLG